MRIGGKYIFLWVNLRNVVNVESSRNILSVLGPSLSVLMVTTIVTTPMHKSIDALCSHLHIKKINYFQVCTNAPMVVRIYRVGHKLRTKTFKTILII